ncbi:UNVERIFIED_CONTAM: hypothetical protein HDU68_001386, partial [Siphonaria sp. JEL0065]
MSSSSSSSSNGSNSGSSRANANGSIRSSNGSSGGSSRLTRKMSWALFEKEEPSQERRNSFIGGFLSHLGFRRSSDSALGRRALLNQGGLAASPRLLHLDPRPATVLGLASAATPSNSGVSNKEDDDNEDEHIEVSPLDTSLDIQSPAEPTNDNDNLDTQLHLQQQEQQQHHQKQQFHNITWAVSSELGYRNMISASAHPTASNLVQTDFIRIPIHTQIEDVHWPCREDAGLWAVEGLGTDHRLFGHHFNNGGVVTSEYDNSWKKSATNEEKTGESVAGEYDVISESGSVMSSDIENDDDDRNQMDIVKSSADSMHHNNNTTSMFDPMVVETDHLATTASSASSAESDADTESTLSSTNNSSVRQHQVDDLPNETLSRPVKKAKPNHPSTEPSRLFILADGHGGILASKFFVPRTKAVLTDLLKSQSWDFSVPQDRLEFETKACEAFRVIDAEYCAIQVSRYRTWVDGGSNPQDRPDDDGCALVAVVVHAGWLVNMNVGDSRMTLHSRLRQPRPQQQSSETLNSNTNNSSTPHQQEPWTPVFTSNDHNMTHPGKVYSIYTAGGHFMSPSHTLIPMNPQHPSVRKDAPYHELTNARIYRHASPNVKSVGVSHRRTLNLTGTMGDLLFKIEPAVLSPVPDVSFIELDKRWEYVMVLATDGIWDHLMDNSGDAETQVGMVMNVVSAAIRSVEEEGAASDALWDEYRFAKAEWKKRESERRRLEKGFKKGLTRSEFKEEVVGDVKPGFGDVALAAEPSSTSVAPAAATIAGSGLSSVDDLNAMLEGEDEEDDQVSGAMTPEETEDTTSVASSNGSTAVASKDRSLSKKNEGDDDDEADDEEEILEDVNSQSVGNIGASGDSLKRKLDDVHGKSDSDDMILQDVEELVIAAGPTVADF